MAGRPRIEIDLKQLESLCQLQPTDAEIAAFFGVSEGLIADRKQNDPEFMSAYIKGYETGKLSLRRWQFKKAQEGNATMLIWLGKQLLGQKDKQEVEWKDVSELSEDRIESEITKLLGKAAVTTAS